MKNTPTNLKPARRKGFTLIELMIAIAVMAIVAAIATPPMIQWRQNLFFRQATRDVTSMLRDARNRAITTNLQHRVVLTIIGANDQYRLDRGNLPVGSAAWVTIKNNVTVPQGVNIGQDAAIAGACVTADINIVFNPNGTAINPAGGTAAFPICIQDGAGNNIYTVTINPITGGVAMSQRLS